MDRSFVRFYAIKNASTNVNQNIILLSQWIEQLFVSEEN